MVLVFRQSFENRSITIIRTMLATYDSLRYKRRYILRCKFICLTSLFASLMTVNKQDCLFLIQLYACDIFDEIVSFLCHCRVIREHLNIAPSKEVVILHLMQRVSRLLF